MIPSPSPSTAPERPLLTLGGSAGTAPSRATDGFRALDRSRQEIRFYQDHIGLVWSSTPEEVRCEYADIGHIELWRPHRIVIELGIRHPQGPRRIVLFSGRFHLEDKFHEACEKFEQKDPPQFSVLDDGALSHIKPLRPEALLQADRETKLLRFDSQAQEFTTDHSSFRSKSGPSVRGGLVVHSLGSTAPEPVMFVDGRAIHSASGSVYAWVRILNSGTLLIEWGNDDSWVVSVASGIVWRNGAQLGSMSSQGSEVSIVLAEPHAEAPLVAALAASRIPRPPDDFYDAQTTELKPLLELRSRINFEATSFFWVMPMIAFGVMQAILNDSIVFACGCFTAALLVLWMSISNYRKLVGFARFYPHHVVLPRPSLNIDATPTIRIALRDIGRVEAVDGRLEIESINNRCRETRTYRPKTDPALELQRVLDHLAEYAPGHVVGLSQSDFSYSGEWTWKDLYRAFGTSRELTRRLDSSVSPIFDGSTSYPCPLREGGRRILHQHAGSQEIALEIVHGRIYSYTGMLLGTLAAHAEGAVTLRTGAGKAGETFVIETDGRVRNNEEKVAELLATPRTIRCRMPTPIPTVLGMLFLVIYQEMLEA